MKIYTGTAVWLKTRSVWVESRSKILLLPHIPTHSFSKQCRPQTTPPTHYSAVALSAWCCVFLLLLASLILSCWATLARCFSRSVRSRMSIGTSGIKKLISEAMASTRCCKMQSLIKSSHLIKSSRMVPERILLSNEHFHCIKCWVGITTSYWIWIIKRCSFQLGIWLPGQSHVVTKGRKIIGIHTYAYLKNKDESEFSGEHMPIIFSVYIMRTRLIVVPVWWFRAVDEISVSKNDAEHIVRTGRRWQWILIK